MSTPKSWFVLSASCGIFMIITFLHLSIFLDQTFSMVGIAWQLLPFLIIWSCLFFFLSFFPLFIFLLWTLIKGGGRWEEEKFPALKFSFLWTDFVLFLLIFHSIHSKFYFYLFANIFLFFFLFFFLQDSLFCLSNLYICYFLVQVRWCLHYWVSSLVMFKKVKLNSRMSVYFQSFIKVIYIDHSLYMCHICHSLKHTLFYKDILKFLYALSYFHWKWL